VAAKHKDRLSAIDASFLHQERESSHMHVGAVAIFDGPPPKPDEFKQHLLGRLHLVPRYRQKLAFPPVQLGRPFWVDDPRFNIDYHVRFTALPRPGGVVQLRQLAGRLFSQRLDRSKPLWELWIAEGMEDGRFALISKSHHALIDGVSGVDIATVLFDLEPTPQEVPEPDEGWRPHPEPSTAHLTAESVKGIALTPFELAGRALDAVSHPERTAERAVEAVEALGEVAWQTLNPAPEIPLNVPIGPHRRLWWVHSRLEDFKTVKNAFGGTVNDVVLTVVTGALRRWLRARGVRTEGLELRALVPVSIRGEHEHGALGNRIAAMRGPLPVYCDDPVECLGVVREAMQGLKESKQALGAEVIAGFQQFAPPTLLAQASRINFSTRLFNLIVTNVPGPQFPLYLLGRELEEVIPVAFLPEDHALAVAIMSYNGRVDFGLLADYDAMPDVDVVGSYLEDSLSELLEAARRAAQPRPAKAARSKAKAGASRGRTKAAAGNGGGAKGRSSRRQAAKKRPAMARGAARAAAAPPARMTGARAAESDGASADGAGKDGSRGARRSGGQRPG
jgi:diacylglycerol O-acyltransferase / wax synthase